MFVVSRSIPKAEDARRSRERVGREREREEGEKAGQWNGIQQSVRHSAPRIASSRRYKSRPFAQEYIRETPSASSSSCRVPSPPSPLLYGSDDARHVFLLVWDPSSDLTPLVSFVMTFCFLSLLGTVLGVSLGMRLSLKSPRSFESPFRGRYVLDTKRYREAKIRALAFQLESQIKTLIFNQVYILLKAKFQIRLTLDITILIAEDSLIYDLKIWKFRVTELLDK